MGGSFACVVLLLLIDAMDIIYLIFLSTPPTIMCSGQGFLLPAISLR